MSTRTLVQGWLVLALLAPPLHAEVVLDGKLGDLAGRIDYGFYAGDRVVLEAARDELEQRDGAAPFVAYYRGFAELRLAQLGLREGRPVGKTLERCVHSGEAAAEADPRSAEPWVLIGACSALAANGESRKSASHERRLRHALDRAEALDAGNPRLNLVTAWGIGYDVDGLDPGQEARVTELLGGALAAFAARPPGMPDWGEAEAAAALGAMLLERGDARAARDRIEQALLVAPGFEPAVELRRRLLELR